MAIASLSDGAFCNTQNDRRQFTALIFRFAERPPNKLPHPRVTTQMSLSLCVERVAQ